MKEKKEKLNNSQVKVMQLLWENGATTAKNLCLMAAERYEWNKNTTYTVIKKLEAKGFIKRTEPGFICTSLLSRHQVQKSEATSLALRLFGGSKRALFSALLEDEELTEDDIAALKKMINER